MPRQRVILYPYKMSSRSARLLSSELSATKVYPDRNYRPRQDDLIINWGNSTVPIWLNQSNMNQLLNNPAYVGSAGNKLSSFLKFDHEGVKIPEFTGTKSRALGWLEEGYKVFCRKTLTGTCGHGIVVSPSPSELVDAPLYTKLVPKDKEYRIHVVDGEVIDRVQKKKRNGFESENQYVRSHDNGWVFARQDINVPMSVEEEAVKAVAALQLDFGAVDVATLLGGGLAVFEVNTAPGIEGTTLAKYSDAFRRKLG